MNSTKFYYKNPSAPQPNKPNHVGVAAIITYDNKILMEYRRDCNRWSLIGGALELDESITDCLRREIHEETSLYVTSFELFGLFTDPSRIIEYPDGNVIRSITVAFIVRIDDIKPIMVSEESHKLEFIEASQLIQYDIVETHKHLIERYLSWDMENVIVE